MLERDGIVEVSLGVEVSRVLLFAVLWDLPVHEDSLGGARNALAAVHGGWNDFPFRDNSLFASVGPVEIAHNCAVLEFKPVPMGIAYLLSIFASTFVALTLSPALCAFLLANQTLPDDDTWVARQSPCGRR